MVKDNRKIAAILAADVVDYSRLTQSDEAGALATLKVRRTIFQALVSEFEGREFGSVGDSLMAEFPSAVNAVLCALELQTRVAKENAPLEAARRMRLRVGVHLGDIIEEGGTAFGDAVNVAARLQALAKPGGVLVSGPVYDHVHLKISARFVGAGSRLVKNIRESIRTFDVLPAAPPGAAAKLANVFTWLRSRRAVRGAIAVGALVVAASLGLFWREIPVPATGERLGEVLDSSPKLSANSIAVLPFVNLSGDPGNDYLGQGIAEGLASRLARIPGLQVASRTSTFAFTGKDLSVTEIADRLGVRYVVEGNVYRQSIRVRVDASLVESATGERLWSNSYEPPTADFFAIESSIGTSVITALEAVLGITSALASATAPPGDAAAYDYFLQGLSYLRQPKSARSLKSAERLFERALAVQPGFGRAQAGLCETRVEFYAIERLPAHVTAAEVACRRAQALDSTAQEVHEAVGRLRLATGDAAEAEASYRRALAIVPQSPDALMGLASALALAGKAEESEATYKRAIAAQPRYAATHMALGNFYFNQGRPQDALIPYVQATELAPDNPMAFNNLGSAHLHLGDFEEASEAFSRSLSIEPRRASYSNTGTVAYYRGRYDEAATLFRKAIELAPADHRLWGNLADALYFASEADEARGAYRRALELADGELAINPKHAVYQALAAHYAVRLGELERARRSIANALAEGAHIDHVHYYVALAELGLGDRTRALQHLRRAKELGFPEQLLKAAPELTDIRATL